MSEAGVRGRVAAPFMVCGGIAVIAGGLLSAVVGLPGAATANLPLRHLAWASAYLVLVVGVAQFVFGAGQARLSTRLPSPGWILAEWFVFNLGNAGVIAGTLLEEFGLVLAGTALFAAGILLFLIGTHGTLRLGWLAGYRILLGLMFLSSLAGLVLSLHAR